MYGFLSFVMAIVALYFLGALSDPSNKQCEIFVTPVMALLIYSVISMCRSIKNSTWLYGDYYTSYDQNNRGYGYSGNTSYNSSRAYSAPKPKENVTVFKQDPPKDRNVTKRTIKTYPDKKKVLEEIKKLKKNPLWRLKWWVCDLFGHDITAKMWEPVVTYEYVPNVEDHSRYMPNNGNGVEGKTISKPFWADAEYNKIVGKVGRSFEVAIIEDGMQIVIEDGEQT